MTDLEIDKSLALAIGWKGVEILPSSHNTYGTKCKVWTGSGWYVFSHKDPLVIWPIAERYDAFPTKGAPNWWYVPGSRMNGSGADTAAKSVALTVIGRKS